MKNRVLIISIVIIITAFAGAYVWYGYLYKGTRDVNSEEAAYTITADSLTADYQAAQQTADAKYLNKTIVVSGIVTTVADSVVTLNDRVFCGFEKKMNEPEGKEVTIKGRCIGYDELFGEVKLDQCTLK
ncbi:OB-fold protein [Flavobacterium sp. RHBU_24]|uniref:OB-fold protein n=1 Tax=Flavobacterium sp. RHBU_24 TaxID=3391185 RepID=UPI0039856855